MIVKKSRERLRPSFHALDMTQACKIEKPPEGGLVPMRSGSSPGHRDDLIERDKGGCNCQQADGLGKAYGETTGNYQSERKGRKKYRNSLRWQ